MSNTHREWLGHIKNIKDGRNHIKKIITPVPARVKDIGLVQNGDSMSGDFDKMEKAKWSAELW
jgi:hypothetical protein